MRQSFKLLSARAPILATAAVLLVSGCTPSQDRARSYYDSGMKYFAQHDYVHAKIEFKNAIKIDRNALPAWQRLAEIDEVNQQWGELVLILRTLVSLKPSDGAAKVKLGTFLARAGSLDEALKLANATYEADNRNAAALALRAFIFFRRNETDAAVAEARKALAIDPANSSGLIVLAADRLAHGETKAALEFLDADSQAHAKDLGVLLFKLMIYQRTQDLQNVESVLQRLIEYYPEQIEYRKEMAKLYIYQHRNDEAERLLKEVVVASPTDSQARSDMVRFLYAIRGPAEARQELVRRIEAGGESFPYQMALAEIDLRQGSFADGVKLLGTLIKANGSSERLLAARIRLAEAYLSKGDSAAAEPLVSDILRKDSSGSDGLRLRASIRTQRGQLKGAISDLREALDNQSPTTPLLSVLLAMAYERDGSFDLAEQRLVDAVQVSNYSPRVTLYYIGFLRRRGRADRIENLLTEAAGRWPDNAQILSALATAVSLHGDPSGAQRGEAIPSDQEISDQLLGWGDYDEIRRGQDAYAATSAALPVARIVDPMFALVSAYVQTKQTDKATAFLKSTLKANPANAQAYALLGSLQLINNEPEQALMSYRRAIEVQPNSEIGYKALSDYYLRERKVDDATTVVRAGLEKLPNSVSLHLAMGGCLERAGDFEGAMAEYQHVLDKDPKSLVASNNLAYLLADRRTDKASLERASSLASALRKYPLPNFKDTLGWIAYRQGDFRAAVPLLEEAVAASPKLPTSHFHLAMTYLAIGGSGKASEQFKLALEETPDSELKTKILAGLQKAPGVHSVEASPGLPARSE
jgi:Tfp pilus assembly protein PilF